MHNICPRVNPFNTISFPAQECFLLPRALSTPFHRSSSKPNISKQSRPQGSHAQSPQVSHYYATPTTRFWTTGTMQDLQTTIRGARCEVNQCDCRDRDSRLVRRVKTGHYCCYRASIILMIFIDMKDSSYARSPTINLKKLRSLIEPPKK